ncbi:hypothetical protein E4J66_03880 [Actinomyces viscosus]|nr:hypothetical protein E4J66_03880 [Actinomyces viscosus]
MFSGGDWGEAAREMLSGAFSLGRNTIAVIEPAVGLFFLFGGLLGLADPFGVDGDSPIRFLFGIPTMVSLVVAVLGLIPVRLPGPMYPEWHEERRWLRAEQADWEARYGSRDGGEK